MTAESEALGQCTECGHIYAVYERSGAWHALGTDGDCHCGNDEFEVLSDQGEDVDGPSARPDDDEPSEV